MRILAVVAASLVLLAEAGRSAQAINPGGSERNQTCGDPHRRLKDMERRRRELHERVLQTRKKEQLALLQLSRIRHQLEETKGNLNVHQRKLKTTERHLTETERSLERTHFQEKDLKTHASRRLREIYEGQRLNLLEMFFQVKSLQSILDLFYYQERMAEMDRRLLDELRQKEAALAANKNKLGEKRSLLGDLVSEIARRALALKQEKTEHERIAERLRTQRAFYEQAEAQLALESQQLERQIVDLESSNKRKTSHVQKGSGAMSMPLHASITSPFGWRRHPIFGVRRFHTGIDLAGPNHSSIKASDSGNVLYTGWYGGYGKVVIISHGAGMATLYAHLSRINVSPGENVKKGQVIGHEGTTGFSTGPHLHFEVRVNGKPNNPLNFVR